MAAQRSNPTASRAEQRALLKLSPFELKDTLISLAAENEKESDIQMLNAGRGNPNWLCTTPREAFGTLLQFGIEESRRDINLPDAGRMPQKKGASRHASPRFSKPTKTPPAPRFFATRSTMGSKR
ncbi:MAG: hypothetical protein MPW15_11410 [Candidatus Manganitrophus sp.]|nr:hypothetical protein [Candidatus Manganitrophus sp.]